MAVRTGLDDPQVSVAGILDPEVNVGGVIDPELIFIAAAVTFVRPLIRVTGQAINRSSTT